MAPWHVIDLMFEQGLDPLSPHEHLLGTSKWAWATNISPEVRICSVHFYNSIYRCSFHVQILYYSKPMVWNHTKTPKIVCIFFLSKFTSQQHHSEGQATNEYRRVHNHNRCSSFPLPLKMDDKYWSPEPRSSITWSCLIPVVELSHQASPRWQASGFAVTGKDYWDF